MRSVLFFVRAFRVFVAAEVFREHLEIFVGEGGRVHFAQAQADAVLVGVNADDAQGLDVTFVQNFLGMFDTVLA